MNCKSMTVFHKICDIFNHKTNYHRIINHLYQIYENIIIIDKMFLI